MTIRIAHLVTTLGIGGQEMVILSLVQHMDRSRFDPVVLALHEGGPLADRLRALDVPVEVIGGDGLSGLALTRQLARRLRYWRPQLLHTHNPAPHQHGALARHLARVPALLHTKHGRNNITKRTRQFAERVAGWLTDLVVPVSADAAEVARHDDRVPERKLRVIHNGIQVDTLPVAPVLEPGRPPRAVHVARLHRIKDQSTMLAGVKIIAERIPGFTLDVVGDGPNGEYLRAEAISLGLGDVVRFHGMRDDVASYLARADLFLLTSLSEGIALTLLEAMGCGLPAIVTDVGGNREVVIPGETGTMIPVGDSRALADAVCDLVADPERARRWGSAARERVLSHFNITTTVSRYEAAYLELLGREAA